MRTETTHLKQLLYQFCAVNSELRPCTQVEGKLSIDCYLTALHRCFAGLCQKAERLQSHHAASTSAAQQGSPAASLEEAGGQKSKAGFSLADVDFCIMHAPLAKMVRKGFARLAFQDEVRCRRLQNACESKIVAQGHNADGHQLGSEGVQHRQQGARAEELLAKEGGSSGGRKDGTQACSEELDGTQVAQIGTEEGIADNTLQQRQPGRWPVTEAAEQQVDREGGRRRKVLSQDLSLRSQKGSCPPQMLSVEADATHPSEASAAILCSEGEGFANCRPQQTLPIPSEACMQIIPWRRTSQRSIFNVTIMVALGTCKARVPVL